MDDFEKAILILFDESGAVESEMKHAKGYCDKIKKDQAISSVCVDAVVLFEFSSSLVWVLQTLHELIRVQYASVRGF